MAIDALISDLGLVNLIALMAVVIIGLPHGAFDGVVSIYLGYSSRSHFSFRFVGSLYRTFWFSRLSLAYFPCSVFDHIFGIQHYSLWAW